jgi:hypothetical protein
MSDESSVDRLNRKLYARGEGPHEHARRTLHEEAHEVHDTWVSQEDIQQQHELEDDPARMLEELREGHLPGKAAERGPSILYDKRASTVATAAREKRRVASRLVRTAFFASLTFFVLAAGIAAYFFMVGKNTISCDNLGITISGPVTIPSGKELVLSVGIVNHNPVPLQDTALVVSYPEGTRSPENSSISLPTDRQQIGTLNPDEPVRATTHAVLFGKEQTQQSINASVEYHIADSNAVFTCPAPYQVLIATAPVTLTVDGLEEISSGQQLTLTVTLASNSDELVPDLRMTADYPFGYEFVSAEPEPTNGRNVWDIGDLTPGGKRTITVTGVVSAQSVEARAVKFRVGEKQPANPDELATTLQVVDHPLLITRPFLALSLTLNDSTAAELSAVPGQTISGDLTWTNVLPYPLYDVEIETSLPGPLVDVSSVKAKDAYFRSVDRTLQWTPQTVADLKTIEPGAKGRTQFTFNINKFIEDTSARDPALDLSFTVRARRISDDVPVEQTLVAQVPRTIKLTSDLQLTPYVVYSIGPFTNAGPYPPRVDQETTYTITWNIKNTTNAVDTVQVTGELPLYVRWLGAINPSDAAVSYNPATHEVSWNVGDVPASTGYQTPAREVAFQVAFIPSITQLDMEPELVQNLVARGVDHFTGTVIERSIRKQTTAIPRDPYFGTFGGKVAQ